MRGSCQRRCSAAAAGLPLRFIQLKLIHLLHEGLERII
jgi:hypothetical protein